MTSSADSTPRQKSRPVHLVGSIPLSNAIEVFETVGGILGERALRIPDGETGPRSYWITSQARVLHKHPAFEPDGHDWDPETPVPETAAGTPKYRLKAGLDPAALEIPSFGYPAAAHASYQEFKALRAAGKIPARTRFQVSLPTPLAFYAGLVAPESQAATAPAFERRVAQELTEILAAIPHDDLAIQWDVCIEVYIWEGAREIFFADPKQESIDRIAALSNPVPERVELGFHLCYGDFRHRHFVEPADAGIMVQMANALAATIRRPISWVHMPVPRDRDDDAYFAPFAQFKPQAGTQLFLGLVHHTDGEAGTKRRMAAASRFIKDYGIATECGLGRRKPDTIADLLKLHAACAG
jgi:methionine synthase II (cobalamin-independent)